MKPEALSKPWRLVLPGLAGLVCGLTIRHFRNVENVLPLSATPPSPAVGNSGIHSFHAAGSDEWPRLLERYQKLPPPSAPGTHGTPIHSSAAEADAFLRMLLSPVDETSIRRGIAFLNTTDAMRYRAVLPSLFAFWAARNPDAAQAAATALRETQARDMLVWKIFQARTAVNPSAALARARALPSPDLHAPALHAIASTLKPEQMSEILHSSMREGQPQQQMCYASFQQDIFTSWAKAAPQAPLKFALEISDPAWREGMLRTALVVKDLQDRDAGKPKEDPDTLLELARDPRNIPGITGKLAELVLNGRPGAADTLAVLPDAASRQQIMRSGMQDGFSILGIGEGPEKVSLPDDISQSILKGLENLNAESSARGWSGEFSQALLDSATSGNIDNLAGAARWISDHDPAGFDILIREAAARIPYTTAEWLSFLPSGDRRDHAVSLFAETHAVTDPARATAWAGSIADPARRASTLATIQRTASVSWTP